METNFQSLVGLKIVKIDDNNCDSILIKIEDGRVFNLEINFNPRSVCNEIVLNEDNEEEMEKELRVIW